MGIRRRCVRKLPRARGPHNRRSPPLRRSGRPRVRPRWHRPREPPGPPALQGRRPALRPADHTARGHARPAGTRDPGRGHFGGDGGGPYAAAPYPALPAEMFGPSAPSLTELSGFGRGGIPQMIGDLGPNPVPQQFPSPPTPPSPFPPPAAAAPQPTAGHGRSLGARAENRREPVAAAAGPRVLLLQLFRERQPHLNRRLRPPSTSRSTATSSAWRRRSTTGTARSAYACRSTR